MRLATEWDERLKAWAADPDNMGKPLSEYMTSRMRGDELRALVDAALSYEAIAAAEEEDQRRTAEYVAERVALRRAEFERTRERCADAAEREGADPFVSSAIRALPFEP